MRRKRGESHLSTRGGREVKNRNMEGLNVRQGKALGLGMRSLFTVSEAGNSQWVPEQPLTIVRLGWLHWRHQRHSVSPEPLSGFFHVPFPNEGTSPIGAQVPRHAAKGHSHLPVVREAQTPSCGHKRLRINVDQETRAWILYLQGIQGLQDAVKELAWGQGTLSPHTYNHTRGG